MKLSILLSVALLLRVSMKILRESHLTVMRYFLSSTNCDSWKHNAIFKTKLLSGGKILRLVIDNSSSMNVISKRAMKLLTLKTIPYSNTPIRVAWIDKTYLIISEKYKFAL